MQRVAPLTDLLDLQLASLYGDFHYAALCRFGIPISDRILTMGLVRCASIDSLMPSINGALNIFNVKNCCLPVCLTHS